MSKFQTQFDTGVVIRRSLFFLVLIILTLANLFIFFRGLKSPQAMEHAVIAREVARGNGLSTKVIRPIAYAQAAEKQGGTAIPFTGFKDTYHSPLNPLLNAAVLKLVGGDDAARWRMSEKEMVFPLDRVIATVSTLCFLMAIGVTYLLVSRIFDQKIAGVIAILMLFCETFWEYSLAGLPQMLMLLLFSCAIYFVYRAVEDSNEGRIPYVPAIIAGVFFTLLALTHYVTIWISIGYIIFAAVAFRPRGVVGITILFTLLIPMSFIMLRNSGITGTPFGTAYLNLYNGIGGGTEDFVMRTRDLESYPLLDRGFIAAILRTTLVQASSLIPFLGGILIAPLFLIALMHPFKRPAIAQFRWAILLMFATSAFGLAIYGVSTEELDSNQTHLLFAPLMAAYGLAFVSILWSKLPVVISAPMLHNVHHILIVAITALPLILSLPNKVRIGMDRNDSGVPHWPPYYAPALNLGLGKWLTEKQICFSDQPWAVAWYADRISIWLPPSRLDFAELESAAADLETPVAGILISPSSHGSGNAAEVANKYKDFTSLVMDGRIFLATYPPGLSIYDKDKKIEEIVRRYPYPNRLVGMDMMFYSDRAIRGTEAGE
jgi:hypothetical protein